MPLLNKTGELIDTSSISDGAVDAGGLNVVPLDNWRADSRDGLALEVDDEPQAEFASRRCGENCVLQQAQFALLSRQTLSDRAPQSQFQFVEPLVFECASGHLPWQFMRSA